MPRISGLRVVEVVVELQHAGTPETLWFEPRATRDACPPGVEQNEEELARHISSVIGQCGRTVDVRFERRKGYI